MGDTPSKEVGIASTSVELKMINARNEAHSAFLKRKSLEKWA